MLGLKACAANAQGLTNFYKDILGMRGPQGCHLTVTERQFCLAFHMHRDDLLLVTALQGGIGDFLFLNLCESYSSYLQL